MQGVYQEFYQPTTDGPPETPRGVPEGAALPPLSAFLIVHYGEKGRLTPRYLSRGPCQVSAATQVPARRHGTAYANTEGRMFTCKKGIIR